jgi:hypothetical protein
MTEQRRLAAIVSADVAGYSRLMGREQIHNVILGLDRKMRLPPYPQRFKLKWGGDSGRRLRECLLSKDLL